MARIDPYRDEIDKLLHDGVTQAEIIRQFRERGVDIPRSSLSDFARQVNDGRASAGAADASAYLTDPAAQALLAQAEIAARLQRAGVDETVERLVDIYSKLETLETTSAERHTALLDAFGSIRVEPPQDHTAMLADAIKRIDKLAKRTAGAGLRWVWLKAALWTSAVWVVLIAISILFWMTISVD